jgi:hypothetical protein
MKAADRHAADWSGWQPPPELARMRPRPVRLTAGGWVVAVIGVALVAGAVASFIGLYGAALGAQAARARLEAAVVLAEARITDLGRTGRGDKARYFVVYEYRGPAGDLYRRRINLRRGHWRRLQRGAALAVRYFPEQPERSWPLGYEPQGVPLWTAFAAPAGLLAGALLIAYRLRRQRWLLEEGRPAPARVTRTKKARAGSHAGHRVEFEFPILSGAVRTGRYDVSGNPPPAGAQLTILYDPDDPGRHVRYPLSLVRTA